MTPPATTTTTTSEPFVAKREDVLHACVAHTLDEIRTLDKIISYHATGSLDIAHDGRTLLSLPPELLLHIRSHLQYALCDTLSAKTLGALEDYESALIEGLCEDCFRWHYDMNGDDIWAWVENGYREACACRTNGGGPYLSSDRQSAILRKYSGRDIYSRKQWLDIYISRTYLDGHHPWSTVVPRVLRSFGCDFVFQNEKFDPPTLEQFFSSGTFPRGNTLRRSADNFGNMIVIQATSLSQTQAHILRKLSLELDIQPVELSRSPPIESSPLRFIHLLTKSPVPETLESGGLPRCTCGHCTPWSRNCSKDSSGSTIGLSSILNTLRNSFKPLLPFFAYLIITYDTLAFALYILLCTVRMTALKTSQA